jgi:hypothetical protein
MAMRMVFDKVERTTKRFRKTLRAVALHGKPAALLRTVQCKRRDDGVAVRPYAVTQVVEIGLAIGCLDQEMEGGAVVPDIEGARRLPGGDVGPGAARAGPRNEEPLLRSRDRQDGALGVFQ